MSKCEAHSRDTRDKIQIHIYQVKHAFAKDCLRHFLPQILNNLPKIVKEKHISHSTQVFSKYDQMYFLKMY